MENILHNTIFSGFLSSVLENFNKLRTGVGVFSVRRVLRLKTLGKPSEIMVVFSEQRTFYEEDIKQISLPRFWQYRSS